MKIISTTIARRQLGKLIMSVRENDLTLGIGRHNRPEALLIKYPDYLNPRLDEWTNFVANAGSFDFLKDEPDLYSVSDLKKRYV
ncbi:MAG TPA: type II toxin-antitoxin system Phd/YefM family antitoxin [Candidatus Paceibacterota bacterium]